jgi:anaphase-promoting complex subunit 8
MYFYALHYYRKATTLRPYDARMWCALAGCYEKLHRVQEAIKCYKRAECHNDREGIAAQRLATLFSEKLHDREQAGRFRFFRLCFACSIAPPFALVAAGRASSR